MKNKNLVVQNVSINIKKIKQLDYISLTDIARSKNTDEPKDVVKNWLRNKNTIGFLGLWEQINNKDFKGVEFDAFKKESGLNSFTLSPSKWCEKTNAIGIITKSGRYGGTYAHKDIAFEFASWISAEFKLFLIKEFQRLKEEEIEIKSLEWDLTRSLTKINYKIHTDAIKEYIVPSVVNKEKIGVVYANEADILNVALFGMTAKEFRDKNPDQKGNLRDFSSVEQLIVLSNLESINSLLITQKISQQERLIQLNKIAISQMNSLISNNVIGKLKDEA